MQVCLRWVFYACKNSGLWAFKNKSLRLNKWKCSSGTWEAKKWTVRWLNNNLWSHRPWAGGPGVWLQILKKTQSRGPDRGLFSVFLTSRCCLHCSEQQNVWFICHVTAAAAIRRCSLWVSGTTQPCLPHSSGSQVKFDWHLWPVSHRYRPGLTP